jgi:hypothetical protein
MKKAFVSWVRAVKPGLDLNKICPGGPRRSSFMIKFHAMKLGFDFGFRPEKAENPV